MLSAALIRQLFLELNEELHDQEIVGEIGLCGGAVMALVFNSRKATKDVDCIFSPTIAIREASRKVAERHGLPQDWLNDAAKGFFGNEPPQNDVMELSNLRVWSPPPEYMLAMKCISARFDTSDKDDVIFLIKFLQLTEPEQVYAIITEFYPNHSVLPKTQFFVEELFQQVTTLIGPP